MADGVQADRYDVVVVGAGNAALSAALSAHEAGARVLVLEKAPLAERGGDTAFTGGLFRFPFSGMEQLRALLPHYTDVELAPMDVGSYSRADMSADLDRTSEGLQDPVLVDLLVSQAYATMRWLSETGGVRWMLATGRQAYRSGEGFRFFGNLILEANGGGQGLADQLFQRAEEMGMTIAYQTKAVRLETDAQGRVTGLVVRSPDGTRTLQAGAVVLACGGFQANAEMRARYLGPEWDLAKVRGTRFNMGDGIRMALEVGAQPYGHWSSCHAVAWDLLAPPTGDLNVGDLFQKHSYPIGIVVNRDGRRFVDEGADFRNYTYAKYGREILKQPGRQAFQLFDAKTIPLLRDEYRHRAATKSHAQSLAQLADEMQIDPDALQRTVADFNVHCTDAPFSPSVLDGKRADPPGQPSKSNWALPLDTPPFEAYAVTCGITFTFGGLHIDQQARVLDTEGCPIPGLYAAGELVGGLFYYNYPGGSGLMAGAVFGRTAGTAAATSASSR